MLKIISDIEFSISDFFEWPLLDVKLINEKLF